MTSNAHNFSAIKHQLSEKKRHGVKSVLWKLTKEQNGYVQRTMNYVTEPEIYQVRTKKINIPGKWSPIVKEVNYAFRRNCKNIYRRLTPSELAELKQHDVQVTPFKYRVYLNA